MKIGSVTVSPVRQEECKGPNWTMSIMATRRPSKKPATQSHTSDLAPRLLTCLRAEKSAAEAYELASDLMADSPDHADDGRSLAAAEALDAAAEHWHLAGHHANAATCWHRQAERLTTLGRLDEAAYCTEMETVQRDLDERNSPGARLSADILPEIASRLSDSASLQALSLVNKNWNSSVAP